MSNRDERPRQRARSSEARLVAVPDIDAAPDSETLAAQVAAETDRRLAEVDRRQAAADRRRAAAYLADAFCDEVTGTLSRRPGRQRMQVEIDRARRTSTPLALLFFDIDGLKEINDTHGHLRGDELLAAVGITLRTSLRSYDVIVRYGGDEFVCVLPGGTPDTARTSIERTRRTLAELMPTAALSVGQAQLAPDDSMEDLIQRADADLYRSRAKRRNGSAPAVPRRPFVGQRRGTRRRELPSVSCAACGWLIPLSAFTPDKAVRTTRSADCSQCGATMLVQLRV